MSSSSRMSLHEVARALQPLSYDETRLLVFHLGVEEHVLQDIDGNPLLRNRSIKAIQAWLNKDAEASWGKLVSVLKTVGRDVLASKLATQDCSQLAVAVSPSSGPDQPTTPPSNDRSQPVALRSVAVKAVKLHLVTSFSKLYSRTRSVMCGKENDNQEFLDEFRDHLLLLPVAKKAAHVRFFRKNENKILKATSIRKLFAILSRYLSFRNYEILREIIVWLSVGPLYQSMLDYCEMLVKFEMSTTVDMYLSAVPEEADEELKEAFAKMVLRIEKPASECTLYDVRKLNEALVTNSGVSSHSVYISGVANKCVEVAISFLSSVVGWILSAMTPDFMTTHHITEVAVDDRKLTVVQTERHQLVGSECLLCKMDRSFLLYSFGHSIELPPFNVHCTSLYESVCKKDMK